MQIHPTNREPQIVTQAPHQAGNIERQGSEPNDKHQDANRSSDSQRLQKKMDTLLSPTERSRENSSRERQYRQDNGNNGNNINQHDNDDRRYQNR